VYILKKTTILTLLFALYLISLLAFASSQVNATALNVGTSDLSPSVKIQVKHFIEIRSGGLVLINDTVTLYTQSNESANLISNFLIGFPFEYGKKEPFGGPEGTEYQITKERFHLDYCFANDSERELKVLLDVGLGRLGFYGVNVIFHQPVNISNGQSYSFTIVFVFSDLLQTNISAAVANQIEWNATFPLYPSIIHDVSSCIMKVFLPKGVTYNNDSSVLRNSLLAGAPKDFNVTSLGSRQILSLPQSPLASFSFEPAWLIFYQSTTPSDPFLMLEAKEMIREITLDEWGRILCSESYRLVNKGAIDIASLKIRVPQDTYDISAQDKAGGSLSIPLQRGNATTVTNATVSFATPIGKDAESTFTVTYWLPWKAYVTQHNWRDYSLSLAFFERQNFDWIIRKLTTTITLPEGADFVELPTLPESLRLKAHSTLQKNAFQETLTFNFYNATSFQNLNFNLSYGYIIFWASFRPTLWIGTIVVVVCAVVFLWRLPRRPEVAITPVPSKDLRSFVDAYEKKTGILSELIAMEQQLQKGRIPRRKYKVRRETLEGRLSMLSRELTELKEKLRRSGARYANIIGQIEVTETELEGLETDIRRVEGRYRRGEISKGAYIRLLEEYHRRRERARVTIDGVLLRLKEEIT